MNTRSVFYCQMIVCLSLIIALIGCGRTGPSGKKGEKTVSNTVKIAVKVSVAKRSEVFDRQVFSSVLEPMKKAALAPLAPGRVAEIRVDIGDRVQKDQLLATMDDGNLVTTAALFQPVKAQYDRALRLYANKAMAKAQFEQIEAQYMSMKRQLDQIQENTAIKAPFSGVITDKTAEEGEIYSPKPLPGRTSGLLEITQLDPLKIDLDVDEQTVARMHKGATVSIDLDAHPDTLFTGIVEWINPSANELSRTFKVRVKVPNSKGLLMAGYFARVTVATGDRKTVLSVPGEALVNGRIYVVGAGVARVRTVQTGWKNPDEVEILSGIREGDTVVVSGNKALPDTAQIEIVSP